MTGEPTRRVSQNFNAVDSALDSIRGFSDEERETVVEFLKVGRARVVAGGEGTTAVTVLGDRGFTWPEFDRWQRIFAASGTFPARWTGWAVFPAYWTVAGWAAA